MRSVIANSLMRCATIFLAVFVTAVETQAVTAVFNGGPVQNAENRVFFIAGGPLGFFGTASGTGTTTPSSTVTGVAIQAAGTSTLPDLSDGNGIPLGVIAVYDIQFVVTATSTGGSLNDGGAGGMAIRSPGEATADRGLLNPGEQLLFNNAVVSNVSFIDPLGLVQGGSGVGGAALFRALYSNDHGFNTTTMVQDSVTVSSNPDGSGDPVVFDDNLNMIQDDFVAGVFTPRSSVYVTTTAGNWRVKGVGYQAQIDFDLAATQPATRRTFKFADLPPAPTYDGLATHDLTENDTTLTLTAVGPGDPGTTLGLDTSELGVGINSSADDFNTNVPPEPVGEGGQRRINGSLGEAIHFSFDQNVSLESLTLGAFDFDGLETAVLSFVSGDNPFTGSEAGYSADYTFNSNSVSFKRTDPKGDAPYLITFGIGTQDPIEIQAGTVLSITADPVNASGVLLDMITVNLLSEPGQDGDHNGDGTVDAADYVAWRKLDIDGEDGYTDWRTNFGEPGGGGSGAVPEPTSALLLVVAGACWIAIGRRKA